MCRFPRTTLEMFGVVAAVVFLFDGVRCGDLMPMGAAVGIVGENAPTAHRHCFRLEDAMVLQR